MINLRSVQVILRFVGGDMDGAVIDTFDATARELMLAENFMRDSNSGELGRIVRSAPYSSMLSDNGVANYLLGLKQRMDQQITEPPTRCDAYRAVSRKNVGRAIHIEVEHLIVENESTSKK